jgi:hypothetical protein
MRFRGQLVDVIVVRQAVVAEDVAVVPEFSDELLGTDHRFFGGKSDNPFQVLLIGDEYPTTWEFDLEQFFHQSGCFRSYKDESRLFENIVGDLRHSRAPCARAGEGGRQARARSWACRGRERVNVFVPIAAFVISVVKSLGGLVAP